MYEIIDGRRYYFSARRQGLRDIHELERLCLYLAAALIETEPVLTEALTLARQEPNALARTQKILKVLNRSKPAIRAARDVLKGHPLDGELR